MKKFCILTMVIMFAQIAAVVTIANGVQLGVYWAGPIDVVVTYEVYADDVADDDDGWQAMQREPLQGDVVTIDGVECVVGTDMYWLMMTGEEM